MSNKKNIVQLESIRVKLEKAVALFFVNYQGLTHKQLEEARLLLKAGDSELTILKNTLMDLALKEKKNLELGERLKGPFAVLFSYKDGIQTAKILSSFFKKYSLPQIKFGIFEGNVIDEATIIKLASIPSREALLGQLAGLLNQPITKLVFSLNYNVSKLAMVLKEIEKKKNTN